MSDRPLQTTQLIDSEPLFEFGGKQFSFATAKHTALFNGSTWAHTTAQHWEIPIVAVVVYMLAIPSLHAHVVRRGRYDTRSAAFWWNLGLSVFSMFGFGACFPVIRHELISNGVDFTICAHGAWYSRGWHGLWVILFVYSKFIELGDTIILLLSARPVIFLHWWHRATVLLFCWHALATHSATGMWYATMNYGVHSVMYAYFAPTQYSSWTRGIVRPFAPCITLFQIVQMIVGFGVTMRVIIVKTMGEECHVDVLNAIFGLLIYASYLMLFVRLFAESYFRCVNVITNKNL